MTRPNRSDHWHPQLVDYVLGNLSPEKAALLETQVASDPQLAHQLVKLQEALATLPYALPQIAPSNRLKTSVLEAAMAQPQSVGPAPKAALPWPEPRSQRRQQRVQLAAAIAATFAIGALGISNVRLQRQVVETAQLREQLQANQTEIEQLRRQLQGMETVVASFQQPSSIVYDLAGTGPAAEATGRLVTVPGHSHMVLVSDNLPVLPESQIYRLWALTDAASPPEYCGQFRPETDGTAQWEAPTNICSNTPTGLLITLDAPNDPIDSAGPLVMQSQT